MSKNIVAPSDTVAFIFLTFFNVITVTRLAWSPLK